MIYSYIIFLEKTLTSCAKINVQEYIYISHIKY